jgi:hypothetical protein
MARTHTLAALAVSLINLASTAVAECVDINIDSFERLVGIVNIDEERAEQLIAGRSWSSFRLITCINGIGHRRPAGGSHYNVPRRERQSGVPRVLGVSS